MPMTATAAVPRRPGSVRRFMAVISIDSAHSSAITRPPVKPSVFSTPIHAVRSRTDCAMVLAVTSSMVKKTAETTYSG